MISDTDVAINTMRNCHIAEEDGWDGEDTIGTQEKCPEKVLVLRVVMQVIHEQKIVQVAEINQDKMLLLRPVLKKT